MKTLWIKAAVLSTVLASTAFYAQETKMRDYLAPEKSTRNVFEEPKAEAPEYDGVKVVIGGDFALQFQALKHSTPTNLGNYTVITTSTGAGQVTNTAVTKPNALVTMGSDFNLPTANLDINAYLVKGVKMHLRTYLSARHHNEAWVKGGYIQIDNLDFISQGFLSGLMKNARVKIGMDEINYGDSHFRRTDNAEAINNPFVENNIMDSFTTQAFGEAYYYTNGFMGMLGVSNGKLNQSAVKGTSDNSPSVYAKLAFDKQVNPDLRVRLSGSVLRTNGLNTNGKLYGDDRGGSRYYYVLLTLADAMGTSNQATGRFNPGFQKMTAIQIHS